ncbi:hypothetical protein PGQ11_003116 [Apiospora arundinis]|uniref:F-box domain-containing protein n=1 Tax=Apiospora arundinis TaxID=335852 RepID=A0ABR2J592_9PEZI
MSGNQPWACLNSPIELWDDFKIPQSLLTNNNASTPPPPPPKDQNLEIDSRLPLPLQRSHLQTTLPTELLLLSLQQVDDPLDKLALALTCKRLLQAAALLLNTDHHRHRHRHRIRVPSIRHHARLEPPCPAVVRLQSILKDVLGLPSPPEHVGDGPPPHALSSSSSEPASSSFQSQSPSQSEPSTQPQTPRPNFDHSIPPNPPFWWTTLFRPRRAELRVSSFLDHPDDARDHPYYSLDGRQRYSPEELDAIDNEYVSDTAGLVAELWAEGIHLICPDCWLRAAKARPHANGLQPWRLLAFR